jgi:hypothetical protein
MIDILAQDVNRTTTAKNLDSDQNSRIGNNLHLLTRDNAAMRLFSICGPTLWAFSGPLQSVIELESHPSERRLFGALL